MAATALDDTLKRVRDDQRLFTAAFGLRSQAILGAKKAQSEMFASALMNIGTAIQNSIGQVNVRPLAIDKLLDVQRMTVGNQLTAFATAGASSLRDFVTREATTVLTAATLAIEKSLKESLGAVANAATNAAFRQFAGYVNRNDFYASINASAINALRAGLTPEIFRAIHDVPSASAFKTVFDAVPAIEEAVADDDSEKVISLIQDLFGQLEAQIKTLKPGKISFEGSAGNLIGIISLLFALFAYHASNQSERRVISSIEQQSERIIASVNQLKPVELETQFFIVVRASRLKTKPAPKAVLGGRVYPNQKVRLLSEKGQWIEVEFFDYPSNTLRSGWVLKKYLKRQAN
jgi:hypothetical protein